MTLEKEEHPGLIRGVGRDVTMTNYYGRSGGIKTSNGEVAIREAVKQIEAKYKEKYDAHVQEINKYIETLLHGKNANFPKFSFQSGNTEEAGQSLGLKESESKGHDSDNFVDLTQLAAASDNNEVDSVAGSQNDFRVDKEMSMPTHKSVEDYIPCPLFWPTKSQEVAKGKVFHTTKGVMLHNRKLKAGYVKVQVLTPIVSSVELPLPTNEARTVFEAVGSFVAWPAEFVTTIMV